MENRDWYFIRHCIPGDVDDVTQRYEVQVLNESGQGDAVAYFDDDLEPEFKFFANLGSASEPGPSIPRAVLQCATLYPIGFGDYVDAFGNPLDLWGNPVETRSFPPEDNTRAEVLLEEALRLSEMPSPLIADACRCLRLIISQYPKSPSASEARSRLDALERRG